MMQAMIDALRGQKQAPNMGGMAGGAQQALQQRAAYLAYQQSQAEQGLPAVSQAEFAKGAR